MQLAQDYITSKVPRYLLENLNLEFEMAAPEAPDRIQFSGLTEPSYHIRVDDIPEDQNFTKVRLTGPDSIYIVYNQTGLGGPGTPDKIQVVTSTDWQDLQFTPKSAKGFINDGILIFENFGFGGESKCYIDDVGDLTDTFPVGENTGASSIRVIAGMWELLMKTDQEGGPMVIDGQTQFGPGFNRNLPIPSDKLASIMRIRQ